MELDLLGGVGQVGLQQRVGQEPSQALQDEVEVLQEEAQLQSHTEEDVEYTVLAIRGASHKQPEERERVLIQTISKANYNSTGEDEINTSLKTFRLFEDFTNNKMILENSCQKMIPLASRL